MKRPINKFSATATGNTGIAGKIATRVVGLDKIVYSAVANIVIEELGNIDAEVKRLTDIVEMLGDKS